MIGLITDDGYDMIIDDVRTLEKLDRFPPELVRVSPVPPVSLQVRSRWPVDDGAALILASLPGHEAGRHVEVGGWGAFESAFGAGSASVEVSRWSRHAVLGFFRNGGRRAVILPYRDPPGADLVDACDAISGVATVLAPDLYRGPAKDAAVVERAAEVQRELVAHAERCGDRLVLIDPPPAFDAQEIGDWRHHTAIDSEHAACYFPWIGVFDVELGRSVFVPPSGYVGGLLAYSDLRYGVQKPPANEALRGVIQLDAGATAPWVGEVLNPIGVNLIVAMAHGIVVWGARSMSSDVDRRWLNECRSVQLIVRLIRAGMSWIDGSPDTPDELWPQVHRDLSALVELLQRAGVLRARRPEAADCVRREGERAVLLEVALAGNARPRGLRLRY